MHWLLLTLFVTSASAFERVSASRLLMCLGAQEKRFHQTKATGAFYDLNQRLIGELIQASGVEGQSALLKQVCRNNEKASLHLLEAMLLDPKGWYVLKQTSGTLGELTKELVRELNQAAPELLLNFLAGLQMQSPTPDCLEKNIPGISKLNDDVKWLQEEVDLEKITNKKTRLVKIFAGIQKMDSYFEACAKEKSKKTAKPAGKPSAQ